MQKSHFTTALPFTLTAAKAQVSSHVPHPLQRVSSTCATYPEEATAGIPYRVMASIPPQQHLQQLQMV